MKTNKAKNIKPAVDLGGLAALAIGLVIAGVATAVGLKVVQDVKDTMTAGSAAENATSDVLQGGANLSGNFGIIGTIAGLSVVIGLLVGAFGFFRR